MHKRILLCLVILLILLRFCLALIYPIFSDACQYMYIAKHPSLLLNPHFNYYPPLLMLIGAAIYPVLGEIGLKLIAPSFGALAIVYTYKLGKEIFDEERGLIAAIILGIIPSHIYLSAMPYQDAVVTGLLTVFMYYFYKALRGSEKIKAGITAGLTALSKLTGLIVFPIIALYFIVDCLKNRVINKELLKKCLIISAIGMVICFPYYFRTYYLFGKFLTFQIFEPRMESFSLTSNFDESLFNKDFAWMAVYKDANVLDYAREVYLDFWGIPLTEVPGIPNFLVQAFIAVTVFSTIFIIYGMIKAKNKTDKIIYIWLLAWLISVLILREELIWGFRRLLPTAPAIALLCAGGFTLRYFDAKKMKFLLLILIFLTVAFSASQTAKALYAYSYFGKYSDALQYIKTLPDDSVLLIHDTEQCLYYAEKKCYHIGHIKPEYLNLTTLKAYNITHVVKFEGYIFYNLSKHVKRIDKMAEDGELKLVWEDEYVKIYEVVYEY